MGKSRAPPHARRPAQRSFKLPFSSAPDDQSGAWSRRSFSALVHRVALERRLLEAGKTFAIFELLRTCIKKSIVAMLLPTILFSRGEEVRATGRTCAHPRASSATNPARSLQSPPTRRRAPSEHEHLQLGSVLNDKRRAPAPLRGGVQPWRREAGSEAGHTGQVIDGLS